MTGDSMKALWQNPEYRTHMSEVHKGQKAWNKDLPWSEETKAKVSKTLKNKYDSGELDWLKAQNSEKMLEKYSSGEIVSPFTGKAYRPWLGKERPEETNKKISETLKKKYALGEITHPMLGRKQTKEAIEKMRKAKIGGIPWNKNKNCPQLSGSKHWNWQGGISREPYGEEFTKELKKQVYAKYLWTCQKCGLKMKNRGLVFIVHHKDRNKKNNTIENLTLYCNPCHVKLHRLWDNRANVKNKLGYFGGSDEHLDYLDAPKEDKK